MCRRSFKLKRESYHALFNKKNSGPDRKLKKGVSYHLNMLVVGVLNGFLSLMGCPWICAASVRTLTHLNSVTIMSTNYAPGEKSQIVGAREQRITGFVSHLLFRVRKHFFKVLDFLDFTKQIF